jgi:hypothetical protein
LKKRAAFAERMTTKNPDDVKGWRLKPSGLLRRLRAHPLPSGLSRPVRTTGSYPCYNQPNNLFHDLISVSGSSPRDHDSIQFAIMEPIYTAENTTAAYQLNGSLALFGKTKIPDQKIWLNELRTATELDGVRILSSKTRSDNTVQFFVSTCPRSSPADLVRSVKGRWQYLIREHFPLSIPSQLP